MLNIGCLSSRFVLLVVFLCTFEVVINEHETTNIDYSDDFRLVLVEG